MRSALQRTPDRPLRFYAPDYRRRLRDAGAFRELTPSEHVVLAALCDRANATGIAWPAVETIADQYGLGESTVRQAIKRLTERGLLFVVRQAGRSNTYRLTMPGSLEHQVDAPPVDSQPYPSRIWTPPLQNLAPIMTNDQPNDHDQQQHAGTPAHEAAASSATPSTEERAPIPSTTPVAATGADEPIHLLSPDLVERVRALGLVPAKVNRYGADRVRWVLDRLDAERARKAIGNPAGWVVRVLEDTWNEPLPVLQLGLPFAKAAADAARPPADTRWARDTVTGRMLEVERVDDDSVKFADGSRLPARMWAEGWEWFEQRPGESTGKEDATAELDEDLVAREQLDPAKQTALAMVEAWMAIRTRTAGELVAKLEGRGLTLDDWEAYVATRALARQLDGER